MELSLKGVIFLEKSGVGQGTVSERCQLLVQNSVPTARIVPERCHLPCAECCPRRTLSGRCVFPCAQAPHTTLSVADISSSSVQSSVLKESCVGHMWPSVPTLCAKWPSKRSRLWMSSPCQQHSICAEWCSKRNCPWLSSSPCQPCWWCTSLCPSTSTAATMERMTPPTSRNGPSLCIRWKHVPKTGKCNTVINPFYSLSL